MYVQSQNVQSWTAWLFPLWNMHNHFSFPRFCLSFLLSVPSRAREGRLMISMIVGVSWAKLTLCSYRITGARCTMRHVSRKSTRKLHAFTLQQLQSRHCHIYQARGFKSWAFTFGGAKSQKLARFGEIAKINTGKIDRLSKSQNLYSHIIGTIRYTVHLQLFAGSPRRCEPNLFLKACMLPSLLPLRKSKSSIVSCKTPSLKPHTKSLLQITILLELAAFFVEFARTASRTGVVKLKRRLRDRF